MDQITTPELLKWFSALERPVNVVGTAESLVAAPEPVPGYVARSFLLAEPAVSDAPVVLVRASGAVGKSTVAREISRSLNWPLIRAEHAQVGGFTLTGLLLDSLGFDSSLLKGTTTGRAGVVIDSLDEAHLRAGTVNLSAFLEDVRRVAGGAREGRPSVIIFSRPETAEIVEVDFAEANFPLQVLEVDFLAATDLEEFAKSYLDLRFEASGGRVGVAATDWNAAYASLLQSRAVTIAKSLGGSDDLQRSWDVVGSFLGYPPVLIALAESVDVPNPTASGVSISMRGGEPIALLDAIVTYILNRECEKFVSAAGLRLQAAANPQESFDPKSLYLPEEQLARVYGFVHNLEVVQNTPLDLPVSIRQDYEEDCRTFIAEHPFVRGGNFASAVFSDYILAIAIADPAFQSRVRDVQPVRAGDVGSFFARFLHLRLGENSLPEDFIEAVLWSWNQAPVSTGSASEGSEAAVSYYESGSVMRNMTTGEEFAIGGYSGCLTIERPIPNLLIMADSGVVLGIPGVPLDLAKRFMVAANEIEIVAESLNWWTSSADASLLSCGKLSANRLRGCSGPGSGLIIAAESMPARLEPYRFVSSSREFHFLRYEDFISLKAVFQWFKKSPNYGLVAPVDRLEQVAVRGNVFRRAILDEMEERGVIKKEGGRWLMDSTLLDRLKFGVHDVLAGEPNGAVSDFLLQVRGRVDFR